MEQTTWKKKRIVFVLFPKKSLVKPTGEGMSMEVIRGADCLFWMWCIPGSHFTRLKSMTFRIIFLAAWLLYDTEDWGIFYSVWDSILTSALGLQCNLWSLSKKKPTWLLLLLKIGKLLKKSLAFICKQNRFSKSLPASFHLIPLLVIRLVSKTISPSLSQTDTVQCLQRAKILSSKRDFWERAGGKSQTTFKLIMHIELIKVLKTNWNLAQT